MTTTSGVAFHARPNGWKAVLPGGSYLPETMVIEREGDQLRAHLDAPLEDRFSFPCRLAEDGTVRVKPQAGERSEVVFSPDTLEWGVQLSGHRETFQADGTWRFVYEYDNRRYEAMKSPAGEVTGKLVRGESELPMAAEVEGSRVIIGPDRDWRKHVQEQGWVSGLWTALKCACSPYLNSFMFRDRWQLFPELGEKARAARAEIGEVVRMAAPPEQSGAAVGITEETVAIGGVVLRRRQV